MNQPKPKQVRLPFAVPRPNKGQDAPARVCGICRKNDSRYTCPRCNVPYCSLACFQDPAHAQCSEPFYKAAVHDAIAQDSEADREEKRKMMEMLQRFEEGADISLDEDDGGLAEALDGVDLDDVDTNELFHLLPPGHRDAFLAALRNPDSSAAKELMEAAMAEGLGEEAEDDETPPPSVLPWWEGVGGESEDGEACASDPSPVSGPKPTPPPGIGQRLRYNAVALCVAYLHTLLSFRLPSLSEDYLKQQRVETGEVREELAELAPFLKEGSIVRYESLSAAYGSVWEAIAQVSDPPPPPRYLAKLLETTAKLLTPPITVDPPRVALVLGDCQRVLDKLGRKKVAFYDAALSQLERGEWAKLSREVGREAERIKEQNEERKDEGKERPMLEVREERKHDPMSGAKIELLD